MRCSRRDFPAPVIASSITSRMGNALCHQRRLLEPGCLTAEQKRMHKLFSRHTWRCLWDVLWCSDAPSGCGGGVHCADEWHGTIRDKKSSKSTVRCAVWKCPTLVCSSVSQLLSFLPSCTSLCNGGIFIEINRPETEWCSTRRWESLCWICSRYPRTIQSKLCWSEAAAVCTG